MESKFPDQGWNPAHDGLLALTDLPNHRTHHQRIPKDIVLNDVTFWHLPMLLKEWISYSSSQSRFPMKSVTTLTGASRMRRWRRWRRFLRQRKLYKMAPGAEPRWCDVHVLCANSRTRMRQCALGPLTLAGNVLLFFSLHLADSQPIFAVRDHKTNKGKDDAPTEG